MSRLRNFRHNIYYAVLTLLLVFMQSIRPVMSYLVQGIVLPTSPVVTIASTLPKTEVAFYPRLPLSAIKRALVHAELHYVPGKEKVQERQLLRRVSELAAMAGANAIGTKLMARSEAEYNERGLGMLVYRGIAAQVIGKAK